MPENELMSPISLECGYDYTNRSSIGMFSFALTNLHLTTDLPSTISSFAFANASLRLNALNKSIKKNKWKKGDSISEDFLLEYKHIEID
jgi:hypothetical protein